MATCMSNREGPWVDFIPRSVPEEEFVYGHYHLSPAHPMYRPTYNSWSSLDDIKRDKVFPVKLHIGEGHTNIQVGHFTTGVKRAVPPMYPVPLRFPVPPRSRSV